MAHVSEENQATLTSARGAVERSRERRANAPTLRRSIGKRSRAYKIRHLGQKFTRIISWWIALLVGAIAFSLIISPLGVTGVIVTALLALLGSIFLAIYPRMKGVSDFNLLESDIASLPAKTEIWLEAERPALPAPAQQVVDRIGNELDTLAVQLENLDNSEPVADEVRRLVGEHLPGLINGYKKVPPAMRARGNVSGRSADQELVEGLNVIEREVRTMSENIARGDLDALATRGRYLEIKYQKENYE